MIIPKYFERKMKKVKEYPNFILFEDEKTGAKRCFSYYELQISKTEQLNNKE